MPVKDSSEFKVTLPIQGYVERSLPASGDMPAGNYLIINGWASDASLDKLNGKMSERAIVGMVNCVNEGTPTPVLNKVSRSADKPGDPTVGIDVEHSGHWTDQIGYALTAQALYDLPAEMVERGATPPVMAVECAIDLDMSHGQDLKRALERGKQLGMSIWGKVVDGRKEVNRSTGQVEEHFDLVDLKRIAITQKPVSNITWVAEVKRSMNGAEFEMNESEIIARANTGAESAPTDEPAPVEAAQEAVAPVVEATPVTDEVSEAAIIAAAQAPAEGTPEPPAAVAVAADPAPATTEPEADVARAQDGAEVAVPAEAAPTPVETTEVTAEVMEPVIAAPAALAAESAPVETVARSEYEVMRSEFNTMRSLLEPLPEILRATSEEVARAHSDLADARRVIEAQAEQIAAMQADLTRIKALPLGRRGNTVLRSLAEETEERDQPLGAELSKSDRLAVIEALKRQGRGAEATLFMMGMLPQPDTAFAGPPAAEVRADAAQAAAREA